MNTRTTVLAILISIAAAAAPLGTEFTYQGVLSDAGAPASGEFDFRFFLYDAAAGGAQVGSMVVVEDLTVTDGRMTTQLDFGEIFDGTALWLEVGVREGASTGSYTVLSPRQELTAAPFAQHAQRADTADAAATAGHASTAGDADNLDGQHGSYYLSWANFVGIPGDLADGDDDTLADLSCSADEIARWNGSAWSCSADDDTPYARTYVVGPVGTTTENGAALRNAISAITPPSMQEESVLLVLEPGAYDVGTTALPIWAWMTIEGAGEPLTLITGAVCDPTYGNGTIRWTSEHAGIRRLTVENTCADNMAFSVAVDSEGDFATLEHVTAGSVGTAGFNIAIYNTGSSLKMKHVTVTTDNGLLQNAGVHNTGDNASLVHVTARVDGIGNTRAIENSGAGFTLRQSDLRASGDSGCIAFDNSGDGFALENVVADGSRSGCTGSGIRSGSASGTLDDVSAEGQVGIEVGGTGVVVSMSDVSAQGDDFGVFYSGPGSTVDIRHSWLGGGTASVYREDGSITLRDVILNGAPVFGSVTCVSVIRGTTWGQNTCP